MAVYLEYVGCMAFFIRCRALTWVYGLFVGWVGGGLEHLLEEPKLSGVLILWYWCTTIGGLVYEDSCEIKIAFTL